ncbi:hypothetical protein LLG95_08005 [bacterium]|nr:hypothetical protein [bacterium]
MDGGKETIAFKTNDVEATMLPSIGTYIVMAIVGGSIGSNFHEWKQGLFFGLIVGIIISYAHYHLTHATLFRFFHYSMAVHRCARINHDRKLDRRFTILDYVLGYGWILTSIAVVVIGVLLANVLGKLV